MGVDAALEARSGRDRLYAIFTRISHRLGRGAGRMLRRGSVDWPLPFSRSDSANAIFSVRSVTPAASLFCTVVPCQDRALVMVGMSVHMRSCKGLLIAWLCLLVSGPLQAGKVSGLYQASVPVTRQDANERATAIVAAFTQVLIKVTGEARLEERPVVRELVRGAAGFVQQFSYEQRAQRAAAPDQAPLDTLYLQVQFDANAVNEALRKRGLPVWGDVRPATLVWLAVERGSQRFLVGADSEPGLIAELQEASARRGIPILLPLLDIEDQAALSVADVWGNFQGSVLRAAERYQPDAVLVGRVYRLRSGLWAAAWSLYHGGNASNWLASGEQASQVLYQGLDGTAELLAARFAPIGLTLSGGEFLLRVEAVNTLEDYARVQRYLSGLQPIQSLQPDRISPGEAQFRVTLEGDYRVLQQTIGLSHQLQPVAIDSGSPALEQPSLPTLRYRLVQ